MYGIPIIKRLLGVEIKLTTIANGNTFYLPDQQILRTANVMIYSISAYTTTQLTKTPSSLTPISASGSLGLTLSLLDSENVNKVNNLPLYRLIDSLNGGIPLEFKPFRCQLTKSYIQITDSTNLSANDTVYLTIMYSGANDK